MQRHPDMNLWLRAVAYLTIAGVFLSLVFERAANLPLLAAGLVAFTALYPFKNWTAAWPAGAYFALVLVEGALVTAGLFASDHPATVMLLFFVLLPACSRLPRKHSLLCYVLFPLLACLPTLLSDQRTSDWATITSIIPGFVAVIVFTEFFKIVRTTAEDNQKLLDELIAAQKLLHPEPEPPLPVGVPFTRRETEVLALVAKGFTNKEIAQRLFLAEGTVKNRVSAILEKVGVRDRTQAALRARELGIL